MWNPNGDFGWCYYSRAYILQDKYLPDLFSTWQNSYISWYSVTLFLAQMNTNPPTNWKPWF